jgi:hypothetical protein
MVCKVHKYADGGKVVADHSPTSRRVYPRKQKDGTTIIPGKSVGKHTVTVDGVERVVQPKKRLGPANLGSGMAAKAGRAISNAVKKRMKDSGAE